MRELQGGDFLAGAGFSAAGANTKDITMAAITIAGGGVAGGITESVMGGNFWNGERGKMTYELVILTKRNGITFRSHRNVDAVTTSRKHEGMLVRKTGLIVAGLNHAVDAIGKPKIYKSPVKDNLGKENGECVLRCLEEFSDSFGDTESDFEYWKTLNGGLGVESNKVVNLINSSDNYNGQQISPGVDLKGLTNAMSENKRILVGISHGDKGHAVMISKIRIWPNGRYRIWFAETSPVRIAPYATQNWVADMPGAIFVTFNRKY